MKSRIALVFILLLSQALFSQKKENENEKKYPLCSIIDIFTKEDTLKISKPYSKNHLIAFPTLGYQPANGFTLGFISQFSFKIKPENKISLLSGGASDSTKKQVLDVCKKHMYIGNDKFFFSGDFRYYVFSQANYGLGTDIVPGDPNFRTLTTTTSNNP